MNSPKSKPILDVLQRRTPTRVPFWLMRQAGRYLPEYRELRGQTGGFLDLVYNPSFAAEVTVQPLRRFGMDAAILFSDILVIPHALGQTVTFEKGEGPKLDPVTSAEDFVKLNIDRIDAHCQPVYETVSKTRDLMAQEGFDETTLIGFCGSPWTVICYMVEGHGSRDFDKARQWALKDPKTFQELTDIVVEASVKYLSGQIRAGAEVIQLFDSWSGVLDSDQFLRWVIQPTKKIVDAIKKDFPHVPVIGFPRGAGIKTVAYAKQTGVDCVGLDQTIDPAWAEHHLQSFIPVQGNLDNVRLLTGGKALDDGLRDIQQTLAKKPFIFNLGHGVIKETDIANVEQLAKTVKGWTL